MNEHRRSTPLFILLLFLVGAMPAMAQNGWTKTRVTTGATRDRLAPSIAIDSLLNIHLLYVEGAPAQQFNIGSGAVARYLTNRGGSFGTPLTVDSANLHFVSGFAIGPGQRLHAVTVRGSGSSTVCLRYNTATIGGSFGSAASVGACGDIFSGMGYPGVAVDRIGRLHVVYENAADNDIHYIRRDTSGTWSSSIDISTNLVPDGASVIGVAPDGGIHVLYFAGNYYSLQTRTLFYTRDSGGAFTAPVAVRTMPNVVGGFNSNLFGASFAFDRDGAVNVVYTEVFNTTPTRSALYFTRKDARGWSTPVAISDTALYNRVSAASDANGNLHVAAERKVGSDWDVVYLTNASGSWSSYADATANTADDGLSAGSTRFLAVRDSMVAISYFSYEWGSNAEIGLLTKTFHPVTKLRITPDTIDFGHVLIGACHDTLFKIFSVNAIGNDSLALLAPTRMDRDSALFTAVAPASPTRIAARDSVSGTLRFCPTDTGCFAARILYRSANGFSDTIVVMGCGIGPRLSIAPDTIDFGAGYVGLCRDTTVMVRNLGGDSLRIGTATVSGTSAVGFHADATAPAIRLRRLDSVATRIRFCPSDSGALTARIIYTSNGGSDTLYLRGYGIGPRLSVRPDTVDFGPVLTGRCRDTTVTIANIGGDSLRILGAASGGADSLRFRAAPATSGIRLGALAQTTARVTFCPVDSGRATARIVYASNGSAGGRDTLYLRGYGIGPRVEARPDTIDFGNVGIGFCGGDSTFTLANAGGDSLRIGVPSIVGSNARQFKVRTPLDSTRLGALDARGGAVAFCPTDTGCFTARVVVRSSVNNDTIVVRGCALAPSAAFAPDTIDFGVARAGSCRDSSVTVRNVGAGWLYTARPIVAGGVPAWFAVRGPKDSIRLTPTGHAEIAVGFCPQDTGCVETRLLLQTNVGAREMVLRGCGGAPIALPSPTSIDFGGIPADSCRDTTLILANRGLYPLTVSDLMVATPFFQIIAPQPTSFVIPAGGRESITIRFCPRDTGSMADQLRIASDAVGNVPVVQLSGIGERGVWDLAGRIDFGDVPRGTCHDTLVIAWNRGNAPIDLHPATLLAPFGDRGFELLAPTGERTILPGDSLHIRLRFCPRDVQVARDSLTLNRNGSPSAAAELLGRGIDGALATSTLLLDFGAVDTAGCAQDSFQLRNIGPVPMKLTAQAIEAWLGGSVSGAFSTVAPAQTPLTIPAGGSIEVVIRFCPGIIGKDSAGWRGTESSDGETLVELRGQGIRRGFELAADTLRFPCTLAGETPASAVVVRNTGTTPLTLQSYSITGAPMFQAPSVKNIVVDAGASRIDSVRFAPTGAPGAFSGTLSVVTSSGTRTLALVGDAGAPPAVVAAGSSIDFGSIAAGDTSRICVVIGNPSCRGLEISAIVVDNGLFRVASRRVAPFRMEGGEKDTLCVEFLPTAQGVQTASIRIDASGGGGTSITLHGVGVQPGIVARPKEIDFGAVDRGRRSAAQNVAVVNLGTSPATLLSTWSLAGNATQFTLQPLGTLPAKIEAGGSDTVWFRITFTPNAAGNWSAVLHLPNSSTTEPTVLLRGRADSPAVAVTSPVEMGTVPVGTTRTLADTLTVRNTGTRDLRIIRIDLRGGDSNRFAVTGTVPTSLAVGESRAFTVGFSPDAPRGFLTACITMIDDSSTVATAIRGIGVAHPEHLYRLDTASIQVGERAVISLHASPPLTAEDDVRGYRIRLRIDPRALFPFELAPTGAAAAGSMGDLRDSIDGTITIERSGFGAPITGEILAQVALQGLITGQPLNVIDLLEVAAGSQPAATIAGNGLVLLSGCDVGRNLKLDKPARITSIQPNPMGHDATVIYRAPIGETPTLRLVGITGSAALALQLPVGNGEDQEVQLDLGQTPSGVYMLELRDRAERAFIPVIIAK